MVIRKITRLMNVGALLTIIIRLIFPYYVNLVQYSVFSVLVHRIYNVHIAK